MGPGCSTTIGQLDLRRNEAKSRVVDLGQGEAFGFLGFDFRRVRSLRGRWRPQYTPKLTQRTAVLGKLKERFRRYDSQSVGRVIADQCNPARLGELLSDRELGPVPGLRDDLGGEEGAAPLPFRADPGTTPRGERVRSKSCTDDPAIGSGGAPERIVGRAERRSCACGSSGGAAVRGWGRDGLGTGA